MRFFISFLLFYSLLFSYELSKELPKKYVDFIGSFDCFSKDDKTIFYAYGLALKYRMTNVNDKKALVKSDLDYWRLWHLVSDMENRCGLNYRFSDTFEEILAPTKNLRKTLKKLRRVESYIHTDGSSESSQKMDKYDKKLRAKILSNLPDFKLIQTKNPNDYNLTTLKSSSENSIPKHIFDKIISKKLGVKKTNLFIHYAKAKEDMLRNYDNPVQRHKIYQKILYLNKCNRYFDTYLPLSFDFTFKRKLAFKSIEGNNYHPIKDEFLPNEIKEFCENLKGLEISTFKVDLPKKVSKLVAKKSVSYEFKNIDTYIKSYENKKLKDKMITLKNTLLQALNTPNDLVSGLKIARLKNCLKHTDFEKNLIKDIQQNGLAEEYIASIEKPISWWKITILMKKDAEGNSDELEHFFDCNKSNEPFFPQQKSDEKKKKNYTKRAMGLAIDQVSEILKYFMVTFENRFTDNLDNNKAIKEGIVPNHMIENGEIKTYFGKKFTISGVKNGGVSLNFTHIPKGKLCFDFINYVKNENKSVFFNRKTYEGLDIIKINSNQIETDYFIPAHIQRLCNQKNDNNISFIKKGMVQLESYRSKKVSKSVYKKTKKIEALDMNKRDFEDFAKGEDFLFLSGYKNATFIDTHKVFTQYIDEKYLTNLYDIHISPDKKQIFSQKYDFLVFWDSKNGFKKLKLKNSQNQIISKIDDDIFLYINQKSLEKKPKFAIYNVVEDKVLSSMKPKSTKKGYFGILRVESVFANDKDVFVALSNGEIEKWSIKKIFFSNPKFIYKTTFKPKNVHHAKHLSLHPKNKNILIACGEVNYIDFIDIKNGNTIKSYKADKQMWCKDVAFSDDGKYLVSSGNTGAFIWKTKSPTQYDIILGNEIKGSIFLPNSHRFITGDKNVNLWQID